MPLKFNPVTGTLDLVNNTGVTGPSTSTDTAIASWNGTSGTVLQDNPAATVQAGGTLQAQGFVFNRKIVNNVVVPESYTMINTDIQLTTGDIILNNDAELLLI